MDKTFFDGLPADIQELAAKAADEASSWRNEQMVEFEAEVEQKALDAGVTIVDVDVQEFIDAFDGFMQSEFPDLVDWADQIAAMADSHYLIEKTAEGERTQTQIRELSEAEQIHEVGRLMGGVEITQTILDSADEMKKMAEQFRKTCLKN